MIQGWKALQALSAVSQVPAGFGAAKVHTILALLLPVSQNNLGNAICIHVCVCIYVRVRVLMGRSVLLSL
jgi:hypothetical protein